jgi:hypothetical protein
VLFAKTHKIHGNDPEAITKGKMRPRLEFEWDDVKHQLVNNFKASDQAISKHSPQSLSKAELAAGYEMMHLCRSFENACNQVHSLS